MRPGIAMGALSALLMAVFASLNKRYIDQAEALSVTGIEMGSGALFLAAVSPWLPPMEGMFELPSRHDAFLLVVLALGCTLLPFALALVAQRHLSAFATTLAVNMEPVYAILLAIVLLGEQRELEASFYAGGIIILGTVFAHPLSWLAARSTPSRTHLPADNRHHRLHQGIIEAEVAPEILEQFRRTLDDRAMGSTDEACSGRRGIDPSIADDRGPVVLSTKSTSTTLVSLSEIS